MRDSFQAGFVDPGKWFRQVDGFEPWAPGRSGHRARKAKTPPGGKRDFLGEAGDGAARFLEKSAEFGKGSKEKCVGLGRPGSWRRSLSGPALRPRRFRLDRRNGRRSHRSAREGLLQGLKSS
jgi:hypothetical protein